MVTDTTTGTSRLLANVIVGGEATGVSYDPVNRTVAVGYSCAICPQTGLASPQGIKTFNADTGELLSDILLQPSTATQVSQGGEAFYTLAPDNTAQVQQNTSEIAKTNAEVQQLGAQVDENTEAIERNTAAIGRHEKRIDENTEGVALALAVSGGVSFPNTKAFAVSGGWGTFEGSHALGFGAIGRVSDKVYLTGGVGMGLENSTVGGRAGFLFAW